MGVVSGGNALSLKHPRSTLGQQRPKSHGRASDRFGKGFGCRPQRERSTRYEAGVGKPLMNEPAGKAGRAWPVYGDIALNFARGLVVALRPRLQCECGNRQRKPACINCVERDNCAAIARHAAIENRAHQTSNKQSAKDHH